MGFCFARVSTGAARVALAVVLVTVAIAAPVEYFQGWIVGRYPDVTDVAFSVVGGLLGAWAGGRGAALFTRTFGSLR
jgi:VanZ family protein